MFERSQVEHSLEFRKFSLVQREIAVNRHEQPPGEPSVEIHHGIEWASFPQDRKQSDGIDAQHAGVDGERCAVRGEIPEDDVVGIEVLGDVQHCCAAQLCVGRQTGAVHLVQARFVRIHLLARRRKFLDGQLFESLTDPLQARRRAGILKRKNEEDAVLRKRRGAAGGRSSALLSMCGVGADK